MINVLPAIPVGGTDGADGTGITGIMGITGITWCGTIVHPAGNIDPNGPDGTYTSAYKTEE